MSVRAPKDNTRNDVLVTTRTDSGDRVNFAVSSTVTMGDTYASVYLPNSTNLLGQIGEMSRGQVLRIKIKFGEDEAEAMYSTYSMIGMTAAYRRAEKMCLVPVSIRR